MTTDHSSPTFAEHRNGQPDKPAFWIRAFASLFGSGYAPVASGTVGSFVALMLHWFIPAMDVLWVLSIVIVVTVILGIPASSAMEKHYGNDPSAVVIDEAAGMWIALFAFPKSLPIAIAAFFLFRAFDIFKPFPANVFDRMKGGFGIMMDDVVAGIYANLLIRILLLIEPIYQLVQDYS